MSSSSNELIHAFVVKLWHLHTKLYKFGQNVVLDISHMKYQRPFKIIRASEIWWKKKQNFAGFSGANSLKNWPISRDFRGKKVKFHGTISRFRRFSREKSQNLQKNQPISRDFSGKKSIFEGFLGKSADFRGNFRGKLRQETISKKQPISLGFFLANFAKIDQFCVDMTSVV